MTDVQRQALEQEYKKRIAVRQKLRERLERLRQEGEQVAQDLLLEEQWCSDTRERLDAALLAENP
jgi:hypothetical protein